MESLHLHKMGTPIIVARKAVTRETLEDLGIVDDGICDWTSIPPIILNLKAFFLADTSGLSVLLTSPSRGIPQIRRSSGLKWRAV